MNCLIVGLKNDFRVEEFSCSESKIEYILKQTIKMIDLMNVKITTDGRLLC